MIREEVDSIFRLTAAETRERIRQDRERLPDRFARLFAVIEERLFESGFGVQAARRQSGIGSATPSLGQPLTAYLDEQRIRTARRMLELGNGRIPTGRIAAAVGFTSYLTWRRTFQRCTGETPPLIRLPVRVDVAFDDVTWHRACQGELSLDDARVLLKRFRRLYPNALEGIPPAARFLCLDALIPKPARRCGGISDIEARVALEHAAARPLARLRSDVEGLPRDLALVLGDVAENLFSPDLGVDVSRCRVGVRDTSISTKIRFYLGDTLSAVIEKRRIETAVGLIADRRFTIDRIAEAVGFRYRRFNRIFRLRTGANPSQVRETLRKTSEHPAYELWCRFESGELSRSEARTLVAYLKGLQPHVVDLYEPVALAVRKDVGPHRVDEILKLYEAIPVDCGSTIILDSVLRTHPDYSAAHWYSHWIRDRLGREALNSAWATWQMANRDLEELLRLSREERSEVVRRDSKFQSDVFLWLLVDCVTVRLFHDAAESEHFADLAVAAGEARWRRDRRSESAGLHGLVLALKANAIQRRNALAEAAEKFGEASSAIQSSKVEPWISGRISSLFASHLDRRGETRYLLETLKHATAHFRQANELFERLRCLVQRCSAWISLGNDPSRLPLLNQL